MIISTTYFHILFSNAKMFTKSLDNLCGGIVYTYDSPKTCIMSSFQRLFYLLKWEVLTSDQIFKEVLIYQSSLDKKLVLTS